MRDMSAKGTPLREAGDINVYSPTMSPGDKKRGHKRMVSNLSTFLPFWWGMNQQGTGTGTGRIVYNRDHFRASYLVVMSILEDFLQKVEYVLLPLPIKY